MKKLTFALLFSLPSLLFSQLDTMVVYDLQTQTVEIIDPVEFDESIPFDHTGSYPGDLPGITELSEMPPTENLLEGAQFSDIVPAAQFFDVTDYPARTAVKLFLSKDGELTGDCSGMLVSENMELTSTFCVFDMGNPGWLVDSVAVAPAFDNGLFQASLPSSIVEKIIIFKRTLDDEKFINLALLKLSEPIGQTLGWTGIAFAGDDYFADKVMHKFSYPAFNPFNVNQIVNGDTMYYNYGLTDVGINGNLGLNSGGASGLPGQGGSTFLYTDNQDYYNFGTFLWSSFYRHERISPSYFYQMENAIESFQLSPVFPEPPSGFQVNIFPNPFDKMATIEFPNPEKNGFHFQLFNVHGQVVREENGRGEQVELKREGLPAGTYLFRLSGILDLPVSGKLVVQ